ncbi:MAG: hypothetical protein KJ927_13410, partial [Candidatus Eisenbacteria bacterium]|nr:hypothetical protein [Candidatus Eisenbacteria bacterium]
MFAFILCTILTYNDIPLSVEARSVDPEKITIEDHPRQGKTTIHSTSGWLKIRIEDVFDDVARAGWATIRPQAELKDSEGSIEGGDGWVGICKVPYRYTNGVLETLQPYFRGNRKLRITNLSMMLSGEDDRQYELGCDLSRFSNESNEIWEQRLGESVLCSRQKIARVVIRSYPRRPSDSLQVELGRDICPVDGGDVVVLVREHGQGARVKSGWLEVVTVNGSAWVMVPFERDEKTRTLIERLEVWTKTNSGQWRCHTFDSEIEIGTVEKAKLSNLTWNSKEVCGNRIVLPGDHQQDGDFTVYVASGNVDGRPEWKYKGDAKVERGELSLADNWLREPHETEIVRLRLVQSGALARTYEYDFSISSANAEKPSIGHRFLKGLGFVRGGVAGFLGLVVFIWFIRRWSGRHPQVM